MQVSFYLILITLNVLLQIRKCTHMGRGTYAQVRNLKTRESTCSYASQKLFFGGSCPTC